MELKTLKTKIANIKSSGAKLDNNIQEAAIGCLEHIEQHGDVRILNDLWNAMPNGSRRNALGLYVLEFGKVRLNTGKDKEQNRFRYNKNGTTNLEGAIAIMWSSFKKEPDLASSFDLTAKLRSVLNAYNKAKQNGLKIKASDDDLAMMAALAQSAEVEKNLKQAEKLAS